MEAVEEMRFQPKEPMDVVAVAAYSGRGKPGTPGAGNSSATLLWFRNNGRAEFTAHALATEPRDQITLAAGSFSGTAQPELVSGGFFLRPVADGTGRITLWRR